MFQFVHVGGWTQNVIQRDLGVSINWLLLMIIGLVILGTLLVIGVQISTRAALILFLFETAVLLPLGIVIVANRGAHLSATPFAPPATTGGLTGIATGFALAIYSFVGWEASAPLAEETDNPTRNVPIALITGVIILAAVYVFITFAVVSAYGTSHMSKLASDAWDFFQTTTPPFDRVALYTLFLFIIALIYGLLVARFKPDAAERVGTALEGAEKIRGVPA